MDCQIKSINKYADLAVFTVIQMKKIQNEEVKV